MNPIGDRQLSELPIGEPLFIHLLDRVVHEIFQKVSLLLVEGRLSEREAKRVFVSKRSFGKLRGDLKPLAEKVNRMVQMKVRLFYLESKMAKVRAAGRICIPIDSISLIKTLERELKEASPASWNKYILDQGRPPERLLSVDAEAILEEYADIRSFVALFNRDLGKTGRNKAAAFRILNSLRGTSWLMREGVRR